MKWLEVGEYSKGCSQLASDIEEIDKRRPLYGEIDDGVPSFCFDSNPAWEEAFQQREREKQNPQAIDLGEDEDLEERRAKFEQELQEERMRRAKRRKM